MSQKKNEGIRFPTEIRVVGSYTDRLLILIETICPKNCSKSRHKSAKSQLPVDVRGSKTALLKLPNLNILSIIVSNLTHVYTFSYANMKATRKLAILHLSPQYFL